MADGAKKTNLIVPVPAASLAVAPLVNPPAVAVAAQPLRARRNPDGEGDLLKVAGS